ncbi:kininogen-1-like isoform X2 [Candoia aspera]|uniref:kininogen-1-like isoform X2 n=1 Tax=Candoia aspera TaxID=51853 RepID=UPI002FD7E39C
MQAGPGKKFHVVYEVRETTCPIAADEPWQNCDLLETLDGDSGTCTADIDIHESQQISSISQSCKISTGPENVVRSHTQCLGCWHPIDTDSSEVHPIVRHTIQQFNNQSNHSSLFQLRIIIKAQRQVVNGWNYHLEYSIKETNCSKNTFQDLNPACRPLPGGQGGSCTAYAYVDSTNTLVSAEQACRLQVEERMSSSEVCAGCPIKIPRDSPELKKLLETALELFNEKSNRDFYFKVVEVTKATSQVVAGIMYRSDFKIQETNCSKAEVEKPDEHCTVVEDGELLDCSGSVYERPWESRIEPRVTCTDQPFLPLNFRAPPGFTPFRGVSRTSTQISSRRALEESHPDPRRPDTRGNRRGHGHIHGNRQGHGHAHGHRRGHGHGHRKPRESSSEEVEVLPPVQTLDQLSTSKPFLEQGVTRIPLEESVGFSEVSPTYGSPMDSPLFLDHLPDLPEPPKCPGTPWKPTKDPKPQDTSFKDFDLLDALQN